MIRPDLILNTHHSHSHYYCHCCNIIISLYVSPASLCIGQLLYGLIPDLLAIGNVVVLELMA